MANTEEIVNRVMGPKRWAAALAAFAEALGVDAETAEAALLEHMAEFVTAPEGVGPIDPAAVAERARRF